MKKNHSWLEEVTPVISIWWLIIYIALGIVHEDVFGTDTFYWVLLYSSLASFLLYAVIFLLTETKKKSAFNWAITYTLSFLLGYAIPGILSSDLF